jgi:hypothetical protein
MDEVRYIEVPAVLRIIVPAKTTDEEAIALAKETFCDTDPLLGDSNTELTNAVKLSTESAKAQNSIVSADLWVWDEVTAPNIVNTYK